MKNQELKKSLETHESEK